MSTATSAKSRSLTRRLKRVDSILPAQIKCEYDMRLLFFERKTPEEQTAITEKSSKLDKSTKDGASHKCKKDFSSLKDIFTNGE